jgi:hypothetical protein
VARGILRDPIEHLEELFTTPGFAVQGDEERML